MNASFRQSMAALHTWTGLVPGWVLYLIFLFGTTALFQLLLIPIGVSRLEAVIGATLASVHGDHAASGLKAVRANRSAPWASNPCIAASIAASASRRAA